VCAGAHGYPEGRIALIDRIAIKFLYSDTPPDASASGGFFIRWMLTAKKVLFLRKKYF
jgi:hypothetical protein